MASRDMASACKAEVSELLVARDINEEWLKSAYCSVSILQGVRKEIRKLNMKTKSV